MLAQAGRLGRSRPKYRPDRPPGKPPGKAPQGKPSAADARTAALARTAARRAALLELQRLEEAGGASRAPPPKPFLVALSELAQARPSLG